jgi:hypothetical protein
MSQELVCVSVHRLFVTEFLSPVPITKEPLVPLAVSEHDGTAPVPAAVQSTCPFWAVMFPPTDPVRLSDFEAANAGPIHTTPKSNVVAAKARVCRVPISLDCASPDLRAKVVITGYHKPALVETGLRSGTDLERLDARDGKQQDLQAIE